MADKTPGQQFTVKQRQEVRQAFARGRKTVTVDGTKCTISKTKRSNTKRLNAATGKIEKRRGKQYLLVRPVDRTRLTPTLQVLMNEKD